MKARTRINLEQAQRRLTEFFGDGRTLGSITPADVDGWVIALRQQYAEATAARTIKRARQFFTAARRGRLIDTNPFEDVKPGSMHNPDRLRVVTREETARLIEAAPCADWRGIIALVRYGGLRCPSEPLALTWSDIDWERGRFLVRSSKLEHTTSKGKRWVPLFPELRPHLEDLFEVATPGAIHVITRYRDAGQNLRTTGRPSRKSLSAPGCHCGRGCFKTYGPVGRPNWPASSRSTSLRPGSGTVPQSP
jgi:integrase